MSKIGKLSLLFSVISFICLILGRMALGGWHNFLWLPLLLFLGLGAVPVAKDGKSFLEFFTMKTTKRGLSMGSMIFLVLAGLIIVNVIAVRHYTTWDFSLGHVNTLSDQSIQLLKSLDSDLKVTFFYKQGQEGTEDNRRLFRELIKKYQDQSDKLRLDFVEVNERPDLANQYGVNKGSGVVFLEYKGKKNRIEKIDEQEVTSALLKVTSDKSKIVYFILGHGETDLDELRDTQGGNALKMLLSNNNYEVKTLGLATHPQIPADANAVAIIGPQQNFLDHELAALETYLKGGGSLWLALDSQKTGGLEKILAKVGVVPMNNFVLNLVETAMGKGVNQGATMATEFSPTDQITKIFAKNELALFQNPMGLKRGQAPAGINVEDLVRIPDAMGFKTLKITGEGETSAYTFAMDVTGRWPGTDEKANPMRIVVYGDAHFLSNSMLYQNLNRDLALNTVAALVHDDSMISIAPREASITQMHLSDLGFQTFFWGFVLPLPLILLATSIGVWVRRRHA